MKIAHDALVMVADGGKMLLLRNDGDEAFPHLKVEEAVETVNPPDREQGSDAPGRAFASTGTARSAMEETDFHKLAEQQFAAEAVALLNRRALAGDFAALIIVAPPATLGAMRRHYHMALTERLAGEIASDLTGHPVTAIEQAIARA
jgi:protein required for attachment to host cells